MQTLFILLVLVALVVCAIAQWPYNNGYYYNNYNGYAAAPYAAGSYYGAPAYNNYWWKK